VSFPGGGTAWRLALFHFVPIHIEGHEFARDAIEFGLVFGVLSRTRHQNL
jgi:hypothetical protein